jgi:2-polyprenyl-3-methyl-5-hydroxy-6-metoxy-1,4-benzoquinol methylase
MQQIQQDNQKSPDLIDVLPLGSKRVIDIGCGIGEIAKEYHMRGSPEYYLGVEIVPEDAEIAKQYCSQVMVGNIEEFDTNTWAQLTNYDLWVFGDVLEHLYDPWKVLNKVRAIMPHDGQIACCIPNVQHWSIQARLSIGDWRYAHKGLLDRTHIRFFTRQTIIEMIRGAGFEITEMIPRYIHHPTADKFLDAVENLSAITGGDPEISRADASVFQYIIKAH